MGLYTDIKKNTEQSIVKDKWHKRIFDNFDRFKQVEDEKIMVIEVEDNCREAILIKRDSLEFKIYRHKKIIRDLNEDISNNIEIECMDHDNGRDKNLFDLISINNAHYCFIKSVYAIDMLIRFDSLLTELEYILGVDANDQ